ncbi:MAG TPA: DJ-1/PfpI family protein [Methanolinea sp.]|nr:DJ-1/PfpI family protein [Methanolinea sp.]HQK56787.1 DJ-1/PfpI family protein [Methanolinea sp.]
MKVLIVIPPDQFRDEELAEPVAALQSAGISYEIASTRRGECRGMLGARAMASLSLEEVDPGEFSGIVLVGGSGSPTHLWNNDMLKKLVQYFHKNRKLVAAICLSPVVLAHAGILKGKVATCYLSPASKREMLKEGANLSDKPVVVDNAIITANGPMAAKEFAVAIVRYLKG